MSKLVRVEIISSKILEYRGKKIMLDYDLARLYGVSTKVLNQAVKRNRSRFPEDFMFQLTAAEKEEVVTNCDHLKALKFSPQLPHAFTEQGVAMLSSILRSKRAVLVNIQIMRAFVQLRGLILTHKELARRLETLEARFGEHDKKIKLIFEAMKQLLEPPATEKPKIGFRRH